MSKKGLTYAQSGVDIDAGNRMVELIKPLVKATARPGADAVVGRNQHRVLESRALEVEQSAEAANLCVGAGPRGRLY